MRLTIKFLFVFFLFISYSAYSQDTAINVGSFEDYIEIPHLLRSSDQTTNIDLKEIDVKSFRQTNPEDITETNFFKPRWYSFSLYYKGEEDNKTVYFYPGRMVDIKIYQQDSIAGWIEVKDRRPFRAISLSSQISLVPLRLHSGSVENYLVQTELHYYNWTQWSPTLAHQTAINDLILREFIQPNFTYNILTILMAGMMFMLFSYSFLKFYLNRRNEYLYNSLFGLAFLLFFAVIFVNNFFFQSWWHKYAGFFQQWLQLSGYIFEFIFIIRFLELRTRKNNLFIFLRTIIFVLMAYCCIIPFMAFSDMLHSYNIALFNIVSISLLVVGLYTAIVLHHWNLYRSRFISYGLFSLLSFLALMILQGTIFNDKQYLVLKIGGPVILYHAGILANLFFFRLGLGQKERAAEMQQQEDIEKLKLENEKKELEKTLAIASSRVDERNRIAKEIHDDIGSGLTSIRLLSEIALVKNDNKNELNKISANANELVNNLNEIIWSINSKNDTLPNLMAYIRSHMVDYLEPYDIKLSINIPHNIPAIELSGEKRRNIFMVIKECFTNIIKHANASAVNFTVQVRDEMIFTIKDNGKGFNNKDILPFKNGIRNMKERMEHVGGEMDISGKNGTTITIKIPLNGNTTHL
jgi:signal transduction histidine kinase